MIANLITISLPFAIARGSDSQAEEEDSETPPASMIPVCTYSVPFPRVGLHVLCPVRSCDA